MTMTGYVTSYHNHTNWSDGSPTLAGQIQAARALRLSELGISDHYTLHPTGAQVEWSMDLDLLGDYVAQVRQAAVETKDVVIRLGVEADFFPETVDALRERLAPYPWDYVIGSVHYADDFEIDSDARDWSGLTPYECDEKWSLYWTRVRQLAESRVYDFVGHIDLPKKYGFRPASDLTALELAALEAVAAADMAIEINTAGWSLPAQEAYPSLRLLREAKRLGIPLLINADAHFPEFLTRHFDRAGELAREAGYTEVVRYERRQRFPVPLA
jgi:histidinol-phosphatase (PHP family)